MRYRSVRRGNTRRGTAAVEFAVCIIPLMTVVVGIIEVGRAMMVQEILVNSARDGARLAAIAPFAASDSATSNVVCDRVAYNIGVAGVNATYANATVEVIDNTGNVKSRTLQQASCTNNDYMRVTVKIPYSTDSGAAWLVPWFIKSDDNAATLSAVVSMQREVP